jgi:hypothetical protein
LLSLTRNSSSRKLAAGALIVSRRSGLFVGIVVGVPVVVYSVLSGFAGQPLRPSEFATFAAAVLRATPAHLTGRNPLETLAVGGQAFGSPVETFTIRAGGRWPDTLPLPPYAVRGKSDRYGQRFITFATGEKLQEYFRSTLLRVGWRYREDLRLGSMHVLQRGGVRLSVNITFYRGTRTSTLMFPHSAVRIRPPLPPPPPARQLILGPALRARFSSGPRATAPAGIHQPSELLDAARAVVDFLRGDVEFDRIRLADTLTLYLSPEAGGFRSEIRRAALRRPSDWKVRSQWFGGFDHSLVPPKELTVLTMRVGHHSNCGFRPLSSISAELARFPHVGVLFTPLRMESCLQSWNFTLVFDPVEKPLTLIAVVYDQFEW